MSKNVSPTKVTKELVQTIRVLIHNNPRARCEEIASMVGVSKNTVSKVLNGNYDKKYGKSTLPVFTTTQVADEFGVGITWVKEKAQELGMYKPGERRRLRFTEEEVEELKSFRAKEFGRKHSKHKRTVEPASERHTVTIKDIAVANGVTRQTVCRWIDGAGLGCLLDGGKTDEITVTPDQVNLILGYARKNGNANVRKYNWDKDKKETTDKDAQIAYLEGKLKATQEALEMATSQPKRQGFFARLFSKNS